MVSKDLSSGIITTSEINAKAQTYFAALYSNKDAQSVSISATYTANSSMGSTIQVNGSGSVTTDFMKVAGFPQIDFNTSSTSAWGNVRMRVAMALDNTGSMAQNGKMPGATDRIQKSDRPVERARQNPGDIYISIIPFAKDVNVGANNYNQSWIDWTAWDAANGSCSKSTYRSQSSCVSNGKAGTMSEPQYLEWLRLGPRQRP